MKTQERARRICLPFISFRRNYFLYSYAELDGKPFRMEPKFSFQDRTLGNH
jgi:hypothetical protein